MWRMAMAARWMLLIAAWLCPVAAYAEEPPPVAVHAPNAPAVPHGSAKVITPMQAVVLGLVEGITEFLPVSSTGHLVLADEFLGLRDTAQLTPAQLEGVEAYEIVIQSGAILAVLVLYGRRVAEMLAGLFGKSAAGRRLLFNLLAAFAPTAVVGLVAHKAIKTYLQSTGPVVFALAAGGVLMLLFERSELAHKSRTSGIQLAALPLKTAFFIGCLQCIAMWPGTSRSMMTIIGGMALGLTPVAAAEFSFLLGLPTLLAATGLKLVKEGHVLVANVDSFSIAIGLVVAAISAGIAVRTFVTYLTSRGFAPFGWYRLALAAVVLAVFNWR